MAETGRIGQSVAQPKAGLEFRYFSTRMFGSFLCRSNTLDHQFESPFINDDNYPTLCSESPHDLCPLWMNCAIAPFPARSTSGIHRLPNEILSYIFFDTVHASENDDSSEAAFFPLTISHTCSRWRKVSISTGSLWTSIRLCLPHTSNQLTYLHTWLSRSKAHSLDILLDFRDEEWDWEEDEHLFTPNAAEEILSIILAHVKRWRHIELFTDTWAPIHAFLTLTRDVVELPVLKSLALSRCNAYFARKGECFKPLKMRGPIPLFGGKRLPALQDLSLVGVHIDWQHSALVNLLELEFKFHAYDVLPTLVDFMDILKSCPDLERLSIVGWGPKLEVAFIGTRRVMSMAKLTRFVFGFVDVEYAMTLLSLFHLPSLRELELEDVSAIVDPSGPLDASPLFGMLERSSDTQNPESCLFPLHQVDCLGLRSIRSSELVFSQFLRRFDSLEKINLYDVDSALLTSLGPQQFSPGPEPTSDTSNKFRNRRPSFASSLSTSLVPCPQLVDLTCQRVDTSILSSVISARAKAGSGARPLQSVQLELDNEANRYDSDNGIRTLSGFSDRDRNSLLSLNTGLNLIIHGPPLTS